MYKEISAIITSVCFFKRQMPLGKGEQKNNTRYYNIIHSITLQHTILQYNTRYYNTIHRITIQYAILQRTTPYYNTIHDIRYNTRYTIQYTILQYNTRYTIQYTILQYNTRYTIQYTIYDTIHDITIHDNKIQHTILKYNTRYYNAIHDITIQYAIYNTIHDIQYNTRYTIQYPILKYNA